MKIALLNPMSPRRWFDDLDDLLPPLELLCLAAMVRPRHEVCVLDGELLKQTGRDLLARLPFMPDLIGIGGAASQSGEAFSLARLARKLFPAAMIVAGGPHATALGEDCLRQCEAFDAVVRGPGEAPFALLADGRAPAAVPQVIVRQEDGFRENPAHGMPDPAELPPPARDLVNLHHYPGAGHRLFRQTAIMASRGPRRQPRPVGSVVAELKAIAEMGFAKAIFQDNPLNAKPAWTLELFEALRKAGLGLEYAVDFRADAALVPEPLLDAAAACGVKEISFGVEAGGDALREDIVRAVRLASGRGIAARCASAPGLPGATAEAVRQLEEKSCREALALAAARNDRLGQAIISARLARIRLDSGDNAQALELSIAPLGEPALGNYDRAKAGVVLAIALRKEGMLKEAAAALTGIRHMVHPAQREWVEREWHELAAKAQPAGGDLVKRIEALEQRLSPEGINEMLRTLAHREKDGHPQMTWLNQRFKDYELAILSIKQVGSELGRRLAREKLGKPVSRPAPVTLTSKLCTQADLESDWSAFWRQEIKWAPVYHRKLWEHSYVAEALYAAGKLAPGCRGLGFGCGEEPLPSLFAKYGATITATDLPTEDAAAQGWVDTAQHAGSLRKIRRPEVCPDEAALARIDLRFVDMNAIPDDLYGQFDFCWSTCSLEHVGSIAQGLAFIINSLRTLKPGGVAVHTTEFNLENGPTIDHWGTVLFQRAHFEGLARDLTAQGHCVAPLDFSAGDGVLDGFVDVPPFRRDGIRMDQSAHLKLCIEGFPCTSIGIIIRKADQAGPFSS